MELTSPKKLKSKLKNYLEIAKKEAVKIKRKSGEKYILVSEDKFNQLKDELAALQKRLVGVKDIAAAIQPKKLKKAAKKEAKKVSKKSKKIAKKSESAKDS